MPHTQYGLQALAGIFSPAPPGELVGGAYVPILPIFAGWKT